MKFRHKPTKTCRKCGKGVAPASGPNSHPIVGLPSPPGPALPHTRGHTTRPTNERTSSPRHADHAAFGRLTTSRRGRPARVGSIGGTARTTSGAQPRPPLRIPPGTISEADAVPSGRPHAFVIARSGAGSGWRASGTKRNERDGSFSTTFRSIWTKPRRGGAKGVYRRKPI